MQNAAVKMLIFQAVRHILRQGTSVGVDVSASASASADGSASGSAVLFLLFSENPDSSIILNPLFTWFFLSYRLILLFIIGFVYTLWGTWRLRTLISIIDFISIVIHFDVDDQNVSDSSCLLIGSQEWMRVYINYHDFQTLDEDEKKICKLAST